MENPLQFVQYSNIYSEKRENVKTKLSDNLIARLHSTVVKMILH